MAKEVGEIGRGFLDKNGALKSKEALAKEDAAAAKKGARSSKGEGESASTFSSRTVSNALSQERTRFSEDANAEIARVNRAQATIDEGVKIARAQLSTARDLKRAIKDGDSEKVDQLRKNLERLDAKRGELATRSSRENREEGRGVARELRVGDRPVASVTVPKTEISASTTTKSSSIRDVEARIKELKSDLSELRAQRKEIKAVRNEVKNSVQAGTESIDAIEKNSIRTIEEADRTSRKVADAIRAAGPKAVETNSLNAVAVQTLAG